MEESIIVNFVALYPDVVVPSYATKGSACFDICAYLPDNDSVILTGNGTVTVSTGLRVEIPEGYAIELYSRSGHGFKDRIRLNNCVGQIDSDYRGEIKIALTNDHPLFSNTYHLQHGEKIIQGKLVKVIKATFNKVDELSSTERGVGGFGSTGK